MRLRWVHWMALAVLLVGLPLGEAKRPPKWPRYVGAMFSVEYPPSFKARASTGSDGPGDAAFFRSPDGKVKFYVFSPMWDGEPTSVRLDPKKEGQIASRTETRDRNMGRDADGKMMVERTKATWVTIRAKDQSYTRSCVDIRATYGTDGQYDMMSSRRAFGIKYTSDKVYNRYKKDYERFRGSLEQYMD